MTDEEITAKAFKLGGEVRAFDLLNNQAGRSLARIRWVLFRNELPVEKRRMAVESYYSARESIK